MSALQANRGASCKEVADEVRQKGAPPPGVSRHIPVIAKPYHFEILSGCAFSVGSGWQNDMVLRIKIKRKDRGSSKSHSRHPEPTSCPACEGSENGILLFLFPSPFLDSSRARQAGRVRMTRKASRVRMTKWYNIWLYKIGFDRRYGENLPALQCFW